MTDRDELLSLVRQVKEHASWLERGGITAVPRATTPPPSAPATPSPSPSPSSPARAQSAPPRIANPPVQNASNQPIGKVGLQLVRDDLGDCTRCKLAPK